jgi:hypothetical protein
MDRTQDAGASVLIGTEVVLLPSVAIRSPWQG